MQVYLNVLPVASEKEVVEVILLENLTKKQILDRLEDVLKREREYSLAVADSVFNDSDKEEAKDLVTLNEYLERQNIVVSKGDFHLLAVRVAKAYIEEYGIKPRRVNRKSPISGDFKNKAYGYTDD
ncbi:hypothetical protein [Nostoc punctiforme]|uniref:Uncharacterized protein n=1 Tax=Nostoc punctiforme (strain ATCC 29133 / PCC 73102) TaxID=63737 RepID=B2IT51_NOSP7|nr:hypothetical protein [Nostoc punctiforme]ACC79549.1 hypothetical protein Npun_F0810 [Nostoc punctiforme PCC 73102]